LDVKRTGTSAHNDHDPDDLKKRDRDILVAAEIAEALAVTTSPTSSASHLSSPVLNPMIKAI